LKVTKHNRNWVCNDCGSKNLVEQIWVSLNHEIIVDGENYVKYVDSGNDDFWCEDCDDEATPIPTEDYKEKEDE
jgi:hypothetical protein